MLTERYILPQFFIFKELYPLLKSLKSVRVLQFPLLMIKKIDNLKENSFYPDDSHTHIDTSPSYLWREISLTKLR